MWPPGLTFILRFRDLVTGPGDTVELHREMLGPRRPVVWWGWWRKAGERPPAEVFQHLQVRARREGLEILLFDSGRSTLHRARCTDLAWDPEAMHTPKKSATPAYYRDLSCPAWFSIAEIGPPISGDDADTLLRASTYHRVDPFFVEPPSRFEAFYDKQVSSVEELRQQDRSAWFIRPFAPGDRTHAVSLLQSRVLDPEHFPRAFEQLDEDSLLWLSDPHFSVDGHHAFPQPEQPVARPGERRLDVAIERELGQRFGGVLVTGDITWRADPKEFELAIAELVRLNQNRSPYRIAVVPGNHDLMFSTTPADKDAPVTVTDSSSRRAWERSFYEKLFYIAPPEHLASGRRFLVGNAVPVEVACLNSSHLQQHKEAFQGHGFVGDDQLEAVEKGMGWADRPPRDLPFRVVMLHHHVVPVTHREIPRLHGNYSVVLDAVALLRWCVRHGVRLVLHGHMHQPHVTRLSLRRDDGKWHTITIAAMGSSGVEASHLGEVAKNTVGLLRFGDDAVDLRFYTVHRTNPTEELERLAVRVPYREP